MRRHTFPAPDGAEMAMMWIASCGLAQRGRPDPP
jgi:hypothetical protein